MFWRIFFKKKKLGRKAVSLSARRRQCSHSVKTSILPIIHFASKRQQLWSCKMISSRRRSQLSWCWCVIFKRAALAPHQRGSNGIIQECEQNEGMYGMRDESLLRRLSHSKPEVCWNWDRTTHKSEVVRPAQEMCPSAELEVPHFLKHTHKISQSRFSDTGLSGKTHSTAGCEQTTESCFTSVLALCQSIKCPFAPCANLQSQNLH